MRGAASSTRPRRGTGAWTCPGLRRARPASPAPGATGLPDVRGAADRAGLAPVQEVRCLGYCYAAPRRARQRDPLHGGRPRGADRGPDSTRARSPQSPRRCDDPVTLGARRRRPPGMERVARGRDARPCALREEVVRSGLRGRGGAGFRRPASGKPPPPRPGRPALRRRQWRRGGPGVVRRPPADGARPRPGAGGLAIAAHAVGATRGFVYVRSEYPGALVALRGAVQAARAAGHLGKGVHGSGVDFDVQVVEGAGSYVAGEETALLHSLEGRRGGVAARPPYPTERGSTPGPPWSTTSRRCPPCRGSFTTAATPTRATGSRAIAAPSSCA